MHQGPDLAPKLILSDTVVVKGGTSGLIGAVLFSAVATNASFGLSS